MSDSNDAGLSVLLSDTEVIALVGGLMQPARQLAELHRLGFWRARRGSITGKVVLERARYEAVCGGPKKLAPVKMPQLRPA